jgi:ferredoxin
MGDRKEAEGVALDEEALERLRKARREGESYSDVILRLSETKVAALKHRGERQVVSSDGRELVVRIDQGKCAGAESCVTVAPAVFSLDTRQLGWGRRGSEPLGIQDVAERTVDSETIITAAISCPYRAIYLKDARTGEELAGYP